MRHASAGSIRILSCCLLGTVSAAATGGNPGPAAPPPKREHIEWCDIWVPFANSEARPKVLLIGDSITRGYYGVVEHALQGKAVVARFTTSAAVADPMYVAQLDTVLHNYRFAVIHFNNGLHGWGYSEKEYARALAAVLEHIRAAQPRARLILTLSTPLRDRAHLERLRPANARVLARNRIVRALAKTLGLPVDDLYAPVKDHPAWWRGDGTHFLTPGWRVLGGHAAAAIRQALQP